MKLGWQTGVPDPPEDDAARALLWLLDRAEPGRGHCAASGVPRVEPPGPRGGGAA